MRRIKFSNGITVKVLKRKGVIYNIKTSKK